MQSRMRTFSQLWRKGGEDVLVVLDSIWDHPAVQAVGHCNMQVE